MSKITRKIIAQSGTNLPKEFIEDYFVAGTYQGDGSTGRLIPTDNGDGHVVDLQNNTGIVWIKSSYVGGAQMYNTISGATKVVGTDSGSNEVGINDSLTAFNTTGFTIGSNTSINDSGRMYYYYAFINKPKFFQVFTFTGNGTDRVIDHNLQCQPGMMMFKNLDDIADWVCYHRSAGATKYQFFNLSGANPSNGVNATFQTDASGPGANTYFSNTEPTHTQFTVGNKNEINGSGDTILALLFAHDESKNGFIKCDTYAGGTDGQQITLGWEPQFILNKNMDGDGTLYEDDDSSWYIHGNPNTGPDGAYNNYRMNIPYSINVYGTINSGTSGSGGAGTFVNVDGNNGSVPGNRVTMHVMPNGFRMVDYPGIATANKTHVTFNKSGANYAYMAIRKQPMATPTTNTEVYDHFLGDQRANNPRSPAGFAPDMAIYSENQTSSRDFRLSRRAFTGSGEGIGLDFGNQDKPISHSNDDYFTNGFFSSYLLNGYSNYVNMFREFPRVMKSGYYYGDGSSSLAVPHGLEAIPEMIWCNTFESSTQSGIVVYHKDAHRTQNADFYNYEKSYQWYGKIYHNYPFSFSNYPWADWPDINNFYVQGGQNINIANQIYNYTCFATFPNISKVGIYYGSTSDQTIDCGFSSTARFVLIKNINNDHAGASQYRQDWLIFDTLRGLSSGSDSYDSLDGNSSMLSSDALDQHSTGFIVKGGGTASEPDQTNDMNDGSSLSAYMFLAFR